MLVSEVKALLTGAISEVDAATVQIRNAIAQIEAAQQNVNMVRATSVDPVGLPALSNMREMLERALPYRDAFVDAANTYSANL